MNVEAILELFAQRGHSQYGREAVTQLEHALQSASLAEEENADAELIAAALLHDLGHLLHELPADSPDAGIDDHHENAAANQLLRLMPPRVTQAIRLHVAAKRYLCTVQAGYLDMLSPPSATSFRLQGGIMTPEEVAEFEASPFAGDAVRLRQWDDLAKIPHLPTPSLSHFASCLRTVASRNGAAHDAL